MYIMAYIYYGIRLVLAYSIMYYCSSTPVLVRIYMRAKKRNKKSGNRKKTPGIRVRVRTEQNTGIEAVYLVYKLRNDITIILIF